MTLETFFEKFELFADAPDAVVKMRELVLEVAVQGRLVRQSRNDEPAAELLERIARQKALRSRLTRAKKATRTGVDSQVIHDLPLGWEMTSLADLVTVLNGRAYAKDELLTAGTPVLRVGNLFTNNHWYYSDLELEPDKYCNKGDLIFAWSASFGPFIWQGPKVIYHYHIWKLDLHSGTDLDKQFLYWFLQNRTQEIKRAGHGVSMLHMTKDKMEKLPVMLPPLAEQKRIAAKVDELMALCDRLEAQQQEREIRRGELARASLARFAEAPTPTNLQFLFHKSYTISPADLRKSILTLAVQGKLVPQNPNGEPFNAIQTASVGKISKTTVFVSEEEMPFDIPENWKWSRLGYVGKGSTGKTPPTNDPSNYDGEIPFIGPGQITIGGTVIPPDKFLSEKGIENGVEAKPGDVLMVCIGGSIGKSAICRSRLSFNQQINSIRPTYLTPEFTYIALNSSFFQKEVFKRATGSATPIINRNKWEGIPIPLPSLAEQGRIVAKVDQLMALVDALETQLAESRATGEKLVDALVAELTTANS